MSYWSKALAGLRYHQEHRRQCRIFLTGWTCHAPMVFSSSRYADCTCLSLPICFWHVPVSPTSHGWLLSSSDDLQFSWYARHVSICDADIFSAVQHAYGCCALFVPATLSFIHSPASLSHFSFKFVSPGPKSWRESWTFFVPLPLRISRSGSIFKPILITVISSLFILW